MIRVKVYGADWCSQTKRTRAHLEQRGIPHEYINIDRDREAAMWVAQHNDGKERKPTVEIDGQVLSAPSNEELDQFIAATSADVTKTAGTY